MDSKLIDGYQWEQIIRNYLPKLKTFQLRMRTRPLGDIDLESRMDELIHSFRTSFWIDEHQWFVRCFTWIRIIHLYTLSQSIDYNEYIDKSWKSSCPYADYPKLFDNTTIIYSRTFVDQPIPSHIRLFNIKYVYIKLPINDQFWCIFPSLKGLYSLSVSSYADTYQSKLQVLLDRASHLDSLDINQDASLPLQTSIFKYTSASVHKLHFGFYNHCFNKEECITLSRSPLSIQCEVLCIRVNNPESIINLVKNMINLRSLNVHCDDKKNSKQLLLTNNNDESCDRNSLSEDELIQWLKVRLPSMYLIVKDLKNFNHILIWI